MDKALGLDLGKKTLGIAFSDVLGFVHGLETFTFKSFDFESAANKVMEVAKEKQITNIALGYPLHLNGDPSMMSQNVLNFKELLLQKNKKFVIELIDERLSTVEAHNTLSELDVSHEQRKQRVDTVAACEILDTYIRRKNNAR